MGDEERIKPENPLSRECWIMFLNSEISNFENEVQQFSVAALALISMFVAIMSLIISSIFSTASVIPEPQKSYILYNIYDGYISLIILIAFFIIFSTYQIVKFLVKRKNVKRLVDIRNDILDEKLTDTNKIRERWRNVVQANYTEIYKLEFLNLRFSISKKV